MKSLYLANALEDVASAFKPQFNIYDELDVLYEKLRVIQLDKESVNLEWWKEVKKRVIECSAKLDDQALRLISDPMKNEIELLKRHYLSEALKMLITIVERSLKDEAQVMKNIDTLKETTKQTKPYVG